VHIDRAEIAGHSLNRVETKSSAVAKPPSQNSPITEHLAYLLAQANREINRQLESRLSQEGVPVEQWRILKVLSDCNGHSMGELADAVLLNHPTLTKMIDRMVSDALVYRVQDPDDRRKVLMFSSDRGKELTQRLNSLAQRQESYIAESYGDKATAELKRLLESLIEKAN
jgi:MarR family transcriptional regulator, organic hydroperoxide resistance regulator